MKNDIHPKNYRPVVFEDQSANKTWVTMSTVDTKKTITWEDGKEYPHYILDVSSYSHPFYTGKQKLMDAAGRVEKFNKKFGRRGSK